MAVESPGEGLRERKRRETLRRITEAGVRLFIERGYDGTTIDDIAEAAGISRRNFFHYFKAKDDILLSLQGGMGELIAAKVLQASPERRPLDVVRAAIIEVTAVYPADDMMALDRVMRASETVKARKDANFVQHENVLLAALRQRWQQPDRDLGLRIVAMAALGIVRIALDTMAAEDARRPLVELLNESFDALEAEL